MLFYIFGFLVTFMHMTVFDTGFEGSHHQSLVGLCVSLVWPVYTIGLLLHSRHEVAQIVSVLFDWETVIKDLESDKEEEVFGFAPERDGSGI